MASRAKGYWSLSLLGVRAKAVAGGPHNSGYFPKGWGSRGCDRLRALEWGPASGVPADRIRRTAHPPQIGSGRLFARGGLDPYQSTCQYRATSKFRLLNVPRPLRQPKRFHCPAICAPVQGAEGLRPQRQCVAAEGDGAGWHASGGLVGFGHEMTYLGLFRRVRLGWVGWIVDFAGVG